MELSPKKRKARTDVHPPSRQTLRHMLSTLDDSCYSTPVCDNIKAVVVDDFSKEFSQHYSNCGTIPTPKSRLFLFSCDALRKAGTESIVPRQPALLQVAEEFLDVTNGEVQASNKTHDYRQQNPPTLDLKPPARRDLFSKTTAFPPLNNVKPSFNILPHTIFGGSMPNMSCGKRCVPSKYDGVEPTAYQNFQQAHCLCPGLGPNT